jgi:hypothetical protein
MVLSARARAALNYRKYCVRAAAGQFIMMGFGWQLFDPTERVIDAPVLWQRAPQNLSCLLLAPRT